MRLFGKLSMVFAAGCLGGVANSLAVWAFGRAGITAAAGVSIAPVLTPVWLYPRIVWGGIWGVLLLAPILGNRWLLRGLLLSLAPTAVQLLVVFPLKAGKGAFGLDLGTWTPAFVLLFNAVWGIAAALWLRLCARP